MKAQRPLLPKAEKDIGCTYPIVSDFEKRYTRLASYEYCFDTLRDGPEADAKAILHRLRQPVRPPDGRSVDDRLKTLETFLQRLREVPQNEAADIVKGIRTAETMEQIEFHQLSNLGREEVPENFVKPIRDRVSNPNDVMPSIESGNITGQAHVPHHLDPRSFGDSGSTIADGILYKWSRIPVSDTRKIGIAIDAFFKSSGDLFLVFNKEVIMRYHSNIYFDRPDIQQRVKQAELCCLCAVAAVGLCYVDKLEFDDVYCEALYHTATNHFALLSEVLPLDAIKVCTLLAHYNIEKKRTIALAFVETGLSLCMMHNLNDGYSHELCMTEDALLNLRKTWRTLLFQSSFLSSTLGYISGSGLFFEALPSSEIKLETTPPLQITVSKELTKLCLLNAQIARMDFTLKEQAPGSTTSQMKDLQDWYSQIPEELHVAALHRELGKEERVAIYHINLMYLSDIILLYRRTAARFLRSFGLVTREVLSQDSDSNEFDEFVFNNAREGILAAQQSARMFDLLLLEDVAIWKCWLVLFQAYTACTVNLQSAVQKQIHLSSDTAWEQDLRYARSCLTILEQCGSVDSIAGRMHNHLATLYSNITEFDSGGLDDTSPTLPGSYLLTIPERRGKGVPECIRISKILLTRLCGPFKCSGEDEVQEEYFKSP
ncbi:nitrate assimilation regulatory protein nirA [Apiospora arundinis]|uniref:Nitrate assimilation regulatory protein nirA n=1 Tax=Apiospora arundinis TaxID=335852 RepID=A0ABR2JP84_9PEZI